MLAQLPVWLRPLLLLAGAALLLLGLGWHARPDGNLHISFIDTRGDAVLIQPPQGAPVLVDGGSDPAQLTLFLGRTLPFWQRDLAAVVLTQGDERRIAGQVAALARYRTDIALAPPALPDHSHSREWLRLLEEQGATVRQAQRGDRLLLGGALLTVLASGDGHTSGLVVQIDYGSTRVVLASASSADSDPLLLPGAQPLTALSYPGERELRTPLLEAWQPQGIVFTTAYQQDEPALLTFYERALGSPQRYERLYHPDLDGTVELVSNGQAVCMRRAHEPPCVLPR